MDSDPATSDQIDSTVPCVLIVSQDFMSRWQAADYLRERGYNVVEATGVSDATSLLASGMHVDIVFSDFHSTGAADGRLLAEWLESNHPVILHLLTSSAGLVPENFPSGPTRRYIDKPYELGDVARHLELLMKGRMLHRPIR